MLSRRILDERHMLGERGLKEGEYKHRMTGLTSGLRTCRTRLSASLAIGALLFVATPARSQTYRQTVSPMVAQVSGQEQSAPRMAASGPLASSAVISSAASSSVASSSAATGYQTIFVDPARGNDSATGVENQPLRTVTRALELALPNTVIVLAPGRYTQATGEVFPLRLKPGVTIQGTPGARDRTAIIEGGGNFESPTRSQQNAAVLAADRAGIAQVAISNPNGYGVWVEAASPTIIEAAFVGNRQTGIYVTGGSPRVQGSYFSGNRVAGLIVFGTSNANIQSNVFDGTGDAIRLIDGPTPDIVGNRMVNNEAGLVLVGNAKPVLRDNQMTGNRRNDIVEVASGTQDILSASALPQDEALGSNGSSLTPNAGPLAQPSVPPVSEVSFNSIEEATKSDSLPVVSPSGASGDLLPALPSSALPSLALPASEPTAITIPVNQPMGQPISSQQVSSVASVEADSVPREILPGAPGAALQALRAGLALAPRAVTERNDNSPVLPQTQAPAP